MENAGETSGTGLAQGARFSKDNAEEEVEELLSDLVALRFTSIRDSNGREVPVDESDLGPVREVVAAMSPRERESLHREAGARVLASLDGESLGALTTLANIASDLEAGRVHGFDVLGEALSALDVLESKTNPEEVSPSWEAARPGERVEGRTGRRDPARPPSSGSGPNRAARRKAERAARRARRTERQEARAGRGKGRGGASPSGAREGAHGARERILSEGEVEALLDYAIGGWNE